MKEKNWKIPTDYLFNICAIIKLGSKRAFFFKPAKIAAPRPRFAGEMPNMPALLPRKEQKNSFAINKKAPTFNNSFRGFFYSPQHQLNI